MWCIKKKLVYALSMKTITFEDDEITYPLTFCSLSKSMAIKSIC